MFFTAPTTSPGLPASVVEERFAELMSELAADVVQQMLARPPRVDDYAVLESLKSAELPDRGAQIARLAAGRRMTTFQQAQDLRALLDVIGPDHGSNRMSDRQLFQAIGEALGRSKESVEVECHRARHLDAHFPTLFDALAAGSTTLAHCWALVDATYGITDEEILARIGELAVPAAQTEKLRDFYATVAALVVQFDPGAEERRKKARKARGLSVVKLGDGLSMLQLIDSSETIDAINDLVDDAAREHLAAMRAQRRAAEKAAAREAEDAARAAAGSGETSDPVAQPDDADAVPAPDPDAGERLSRTEARGLAAVAFFLGKRTADGGVEYCEKDATQVVVNLVVDTTTLAGIENNLALTGTDPLVADLARALAVSPDALRRLLVDPSRGHLLDYGQTQYLPRRLRRHDLARDGGRCRCCGRRIRRGEMDHLVDFRLGGPSSAGNSRILCPECHQRKTAGLLAVTGDAGSAEGVQITFDAGITFTSYPPPVLPRPERDALLHAQAEPLRYTPRPQRRRAEEARRGASSDLGGGPGSSDGRRSGAALPEPAPDVLPRAGSDDPPPF
jgi:hypothetical protein